MDSVVKMSFKQKLVYMALGATFAALGYLFVTQLWDEDKSAADGTAKELLKRMYRLAKKEMATGDYKKAAEILRPLAAIEYPPYKDEDYGYGLGHLCERYDKQLGNERKLTLFSGSLAKFLGLEYRE